MHELLQVTVWKQEGWIDRLVDAVATTERSEELDSCPKKPLFWSHFLAPNSFELFQLSKWFPNTAGRIIPHSETNFMKVFILVYFFYPFYELLIIECSLFTSFSIDFYIKVVPLETPGLVDVTTWLMLGSSLTLVQNIKTIQCND